MFLAAVEEVSAHFRVEWKAQGKKQWTDGQQRGGAADDSRCGWSGSEGN